MHALIHSIEKAVVTYSEKLFCGVGKKKLEAELRWHARSSCILSVVTIVDVRFYMMAHVGAGMS